MECPFFYTYLLRFVFRLETFCNASIEASRIRRTESCLYGTFWAGSKYLYLVNGSFIKKVPVSRNVFKFFLSSVIMPISAPMAWVTKTQADAWPSAHAFMSRPTCDIFDSEMFKSRVMLEPHIAVLFVIAVSYTHLTLPTIVGV